MPMLHPPFPERIAENRLWRLEQALSDERYFVRRPRRTSAEKGRVYGVTGGVRTARSTAVTARGR